MAADKPYPDPERMERALMMILRKTCGTCESSTSGIGSCYKNGRTAGAKCGEEQACDACIAYRALFSVDMAI